MDLIGKKLWHYRIESVLGAGGSATVYQAFDERNDRPVAIKILPEGLDAAQLQRFKQETKVLSQLDHPNIVQILDIGSAEGRFFYVMESISSSTLKDLIARRFSRGGKGFTLAEILTLASDICEALQCSHENGVFHRDVKPSNILVTKQMKSILFDFGLAKWLDEKTLTQAGTLMGTPLYMSPEQLRGGDVDQRSDIYQVGLVLYQLVTGQVPFADETPYISATRRLNEAIPPPSSKKDGIPGGLEQIIMRCLERDGQRRYKTMADMLEDLARISSASTSGATSDKTIIRRLPDSVPAKRVAAVVLAALIVLGVTYALSSDPGPTVHVRAFTVVPGREEAVLSFRTDPPLRSEVIFGDPDDLVRRLELSWQEATQHRGSLRDLEPGHTYAYQVRLLMEPDRMKALPVRQFTTLPPGATQGR